MTEDTTREAVVQALAVLQQATSLDFSGDVDGAIAMYMVATSRLDAVAAVLPAELATTVRRNAEEVRRKVELLRRSRASEQQLSAFPAFAIQFVPAPMPAEDYRVPRNGVMRVFWLMRLLVRSIQQGGFLAPNLYVPKSVWFQDGGAASLHFISYKIRYLASLCEALEPLLSMNTLGNLNKTIATLTAFAEAEQELRDALDHDMGRSKKKDWKPPKKSVWDVFSRKSKIWRGQEGNLELLLTWACNALETAQVLERWYLYFAQAPAVTAGAPQSPEMARVVELIRRLSAQFYTGPCAFLLHDVAVLVERYQGKSCRSVTKLLPSEPKLEGDS